MLKPSRHALTPRRLRVEPLEDRRMLAVATVTTELDVVDFGDGVTSLREAIFATNVLSGADTIEFAPSLSGKTIHMNQALGEFDITDSLTIDASGLAGGITIDAGNGTDGLFGTFDGIRIFNVDDGNASNLLDVEIVGLTLAAADSPLFQLGGAIRSLENLIIAECSITGNSAFYKGGGIYVRHGSLTVNDSLIADNFVRHGQGGGIYTSGDVTMTGSTISSNYVRSDVSLSTTGGGGIYAKGDVIITNCTIAGNSTRGNWAGGVESRPGATLRSPTAL